MCPNKGAPCAVALWHAAAAVNGVPCAAAPCTAPSLPAWLWQDSLCVMPAGARIRTWAYSTLYLWPVHASDCATPSSVYQGLGITLKETRA